MNHSMTISSRRTKLESMLAASPHDQLLRYMLAMELDKDGEHSRALELFDSLMSDQAPYVPAFLMAGQLLVRIGRISDARVIYARGIAEANAQGNSHAAGEMTGFLDALS